jgi:arginase
MRPVSIAGDCCTALGVVAGLRDAGYSPVLIWLDAHGDFNTPETTPSGFLGGMPLAMLVGRGDQTLVKALKLEPLKESQVILSDARDLDPGEKQAVEGSHLHYVRDLAAVLDGIPAAPPLYVHLDVDLIDPTQAPAMSYRAPGGPSAATVKSLLRALMQTERLAAISVSAWNPDLDTDGKTQAICMDVLGPLFNH